MLYLISFHFDFSALCPLIQYPCPAPRSPTPLPPATPATNFTSLNAAPCVQYFYAVSDLQFAFVSTRVYIYINICLNGCVWVFNGYRRAHIYTYIHAHVHVYVCIVEGT